MLFGNLKTAEKYFQQALYCRLRLHEEVHFYMGVLYNNVSEVYSRLGDRDKAMSFLEKGMAIKKLTKAHSKSMVSSIVMMASQYITGGHDLEKGKNILDSGLEIRKRCPLDDLSTSSLLQAMGEYHLVSGQFEDAARTYKCALVLKMKIHPYHHTTFETRARYGQALYKVGKFEEAWEELHRLMDHKAMLTEEYPESEVILRAGEFLTYSLIRLNRHAEASLSYRTLKLEILKVIDECHTLQNRSRKDSRLKLLDFYNDSVIRLLSRQ